MPIDLKIVYTQISEVFFFNLSFQFDDKNKKRKMEGKKLCSSKNLCLENRLRILPKNFMSVKEL